MTLANIASPTDVRAALQSGRDETARRTVAGGRSVEGAKLDRSDRGRGAEAGGVAVLRGRGVDPVFDGAEALEHLVPGVLAGEYGPHRGRILGEGAQGGDEGAQLPSVESANQT